MKLKAERGGNDWEIRLKIWKIIKNSGDFS